MVFGIQVTFDAGDPGALAAFWAQVLGYVADPPPEGFASWEDWLREEGIPEEQWNDASGIGDPDGSGSRIFFQRVPEGKTAKNRVHLDVRAAPGLDAEPRRRRLFEEATSDRFGSDEAVRVRRARAVLDHHAGSGG